MRVTFFTSLAFAAAFSMGCSDGAAPMEAREHTDETGSAIVGGAASGDEDDAVVGIGIHDTNGRLIETCSGTLVAPNLVLTARHCVSSVSSGGVQCDMTGGAVVGAKVLVDHPADKLRVYLGRAAVATARSELTAATPKESAHGVRVIEDDATEICNSDVALIMLDHDLEHTTYAPLHYAMPQLSDRLEAVGFGLTEDGTVPASRLRRDVTVAGIGPYAKTGLGDNELMVTEGPCEGDSGGPLFNANHAVVGVFSRIAGGTGTNKAALCIGKTAHGTYESIVKKRALIESAFVAAGKTEWLDGEPSPFIVAPAPAADAAPAADPAPAATIEDASSGGCSSSPRGASSGALGLGLVLGLALASRRSCRRGRRAGSSTTCSSAARRTTRS